MSPRKLRLDEPRECKQCFRVVLANNFRRHLSSHDHQVKACVLAMGRKILSKCVACKNTKIAKIRAQCIKCCQTLEKMYDAILKPLEKSNEITEASSSVPHPLNVSKLDHKLPSQVHKASKSKTALPLNFSSMPSSTKPPINKQLSSPSYGDQSFEKSQKTSNATVSPKSLKLSISNKNPQHDPKPPNEQSYEKPHASGSKRSSLSSKTSYVNQKLSQRTSDECSYTSSNSNSVSKQSSLNACSPSPSQPSMGSCKEEHLEMSNSKVFPLSDKPILSNEHYYPQSYDNKAFEKVHRTILSNGSLTVTTCPSDLQKQSECTTISVQVVEKSPNVSEYIFKFCKKSTPSDNQQQNAPQSSLVQPDNINELVSQLDQSNKTQDNQRDPGAFNSFEQDTIDRFPDINSDEPARPLLPMTTNDLVTTLSASNESVETIVYDDWYLATDLELTDIQNQIDPENEGVGKPRIKCRDLSSLMP